MKLHIIFILFICFLSSKVSAQFPSDDPLAWHEDFNDDFSYLNWADFKSQNKDANSGGSRIPAWTLNIWGLDGIDPFHKSNPLSWEYSMQTSDNGKNLGFSPDPTSDACSCDYITIITDNDHKTINLPGGGTKELKYSTVFLSTNPNEVVNGVIPGLFHYGYYEVSMRVRDYDKIYKVYVDHPETNSIFGYATTKNGGVTPNVWFLNGGDWPTPCWNEIDMTETQDNFNGSYANLHIQWKIPHNLPQFPDPDLTPLYDATWGGQGLKAYGENKTVVYNGQFHTLGLEWTSRYVKYYLDHQLVRVVNKYANQLNPMYIILNGDISDEGYKNGTGVTSLTKFPYKFDINYVKYWKLDMSTRWDDLTIDGYYQLEHYDHKVKKEITVSDRYTTRVRSGHPVTLRAVDRITLGSVNLNGAYFSVPLGTTFSAVTTGPY